MTVTELNAIMQGHARRTEFLNDRMTWPTAITQHLDNPGSADCGVNDQFEYF